MDETDYEALCDDFMELAHRYGCPSDVPVVAWLESQLARLKEIDDFMDGEPT